MLLLFIFINLAIQPNDDDDKVVKCPSISKFIISLEKRHNKINYTWILCLKETLYLIAALTLV